MEGNFPCWSHIWDGFWQELLPWRRATYMINLELRILHEEGNTHTCSILVWHQPNDWKSQSATISCQKSTARIHFSYRVEWWSLVIDGVVDERKFNVKTRPPPWHVLNLSHACQSHTSKGMAHKHSEIPHILLTEGLSPEMIQLSNTVKLILDPFAGHFTSDASS